MIDRRKDSQHVLIGFLFFMVLGALLFLLINGALDSWNK
jgi:hypothetical protein